MPLAASSIVANTEVDALLQGLTTAAGREDPYPAYARLRTIAPLASAPDGALVLTRYADCDALLRQPQCGRADPDALFAAIGMPQWREHVGIRQFSTSVLTLNPPDHTRIRRLVSGVFTPRRVASLQPAITALTRSLLSEMSGTVNFIDAFAFPLPVAVIGELLGVPAADRPQFQPLVRDWTLLLDVYGPDVLARGDAAAGRIRDYLADLAAQRRRQPRPDLMTALVQAESDGERLTEDELLTTAALLFAAGFETTTHLLGNALVALLASPAELDRLRRSPELAASAVLELLRYDSSVQITARTALSDTELNGVPLPAGQRVVAYLGAANRDPARFPDPDRLDLARPDNAPLSFGGGIHYCLGAALARLEGEIALPALFERFPRIALAGPPERRDSLTLRGYLSLPVSLN